MSHNSEKKKKFVVINDDIAVQKHRKTCSHEPNGPLFLKLHYLFSSGPLFKKNPLLRNARRYQLCGPSFSKGAHH